MPQVNAVEYSPQKDSFWAFEDTMADRTGAAGQHRESQRAWDRAADDAAEVIIIVIVGIRNWASVLPERERDDRPIDRERPRHFGHQPVECRIFSRQG